MIVRARLTTGPSARGPTPCARIDAPALPARESTEVTTGRPATAHAGSLGVSSMRQS